MAEKLLAILILLWFAALISVAAWCLVRPNNPLNEAGYEFWRYFFKDETAASVNRVHNIVVCVFILIIGVILFITALCELF